MPSSSLRSGVGATVIGAGFVVFVLVAVYDMAREDALTRIAEMGSRGAEVAGFPDKDEEVPDPAPTQTDGVANRAGNQEVPDDGAPEAPEEVVTAPVPAEEPPAPVPTIGEEAAPDAGDQEVLDDGAPEAPEEVAAAPVPAEEPLAPVPSTGEDAAPEAGDQEVPDDGVPEVPEEVVTATVPEEESPAPVPATGEDTAPEAGDQEVPDDGSAQVAAVVEAVPVPEEESPAPVPATGEDAAPEAGDQEVPGDGSAQVAAVVEAVPVPEEESPAPVPATGEDTAPEAGDQEVPGDGSAQVAAVVEAVPVPEEESPAPVPATGEDTAPEAGDQEVPGDSAPEAPEEVVTAPVPAEESAAPVPTTNEDTAPEGRDQEVPDNGAPEIPEEVVTAAVSEEESPAPVPTPGEDAAPEAGEQEVPDDGAPEVPEEVVTAAVAEQESPAPVPTPGEDAAPEASDQEVPDDSASEAPEEVVTVPVPAEELAAPVPSTIAVAAPEAGGQAVPDDGAGEGTPKEVVTAPVPAEESAAPVPTTGEDAASEARDRETAVSRDAQVPADVAHSPDAEETARVSTSVESEDAALVKSRQEAPDGMDTEALPEDAAEQAAAEALPGPTPPDSMSASSESGTPDPVVRGERQASEDTAPETDGQDVSSIEDPDAPTATSTGSPAEETPAIPRTPVGESADRPVTGNVANSAESPSPASQEAIADDPGALQERASADAGTDVEHPIPESSAGTAVAALPPAPEDVPTTVTSEPMPADIAQYDVVQVSPDGRIVVAGRTESGATVDLLNDGVVIGTELADRNGEFVFIPDLQLKPGVRELSLAVRTDDGSGVRVTSRTVVIVIPDREVVAGNVPETDEAAVGGTAVALLVDEEGETVRILDSGEVLADPDTVLSLTTVTFDEAGYASITGGGESGQQVNLYLDNTLVGTAVINEEGYWTIRTQRPLATTGSYKLRVDQTEPGGDAVSERIVTTLVRAAGKLLPASATVVTVEKGMTLWGISRRHYGRGILYTLIYNSNNYQIADPHWIYPGQKFLIPRREPSSRE